MTTQHGTLEARVEASLRSCQGDVDAMTDYLLRAVPLIKDYVEDAGHEQDQARGHLDSFVEITATSSKHAILQRYMAEVDGNLEVLDKQAPAPLVQHPTSTRRRRDLRRDFDPTDWVCRSCDTPTVLDAASAAMVCPLCGMTTPHMEMTGMSFNDRVTTEVVSHCAYKRNNHFGRFTCVVLASTHVFVPASTHVYFFLT